MRIGVTGGIGSGKSTVTRLLADKGAVIVDADEIAREVVAPGSPVLATLALEFGHDIIDRDGSLKRGLLAERAFASPEATTALNAITHPAIRRRSAETMRRLSETHSIVVHDMPLLVEMGLVGDYDHIIVVETPLEARLERLEERGIGREDALRRIAAQATDQQRRDIASIVLQNDSTIDALEAQVNQWWAETIAADAS